MRNNKQQSNINIFSLIGTGKQNARSMEELARTLNLDAREIRKVVERARCEGKVICGTNAGYYLPGGILELKEYIHRNESRIATAEKTLSPALDLLERWEQEGESCA